MNKERFGNLTILLLVFVMLCGGLGIPVVYATELPGQIVVTKGKPEKPPASEKIYYNNALDVFALQQMPADKTLAPAVFSKIFLFTNKGWAAVTADFSYSEDYVAFRRTANFVFVSRKYNINPYPVNSADYNRYFYNMAQSEQLAINELQLDEVPASNAVVAGHGLDYDFRLPVLKDLVAVRTVPGRGETQKETIEFISLLLPDRLFTTLRVYDKPDWAVMTAEAKKAAGSVALDFMNRVFVLSPKQPNPHVPDSPNAVTYDAAYQAIMDAVAQAYLYHPSGVGEPIDISGGATYTDLYVNGISVSKGILLDGKNRPLVPARALLQALGFQIEWKAETSSFIVLKEENLVAAKTVGSTHTLADYKSAVDAIDCAVIGGVLYVDLDFVVNTLHCAVSLNRPINAIAVRAI